MNVFLGGGGEGGLRVSPHRIFNSFFSQKTKKQKKFGITALHIASLKGDEKNVELLLKEGAKSNAVEQVFFFN